MTATGKVLEVSGRRPYLSIWTLVAALTLLVAPRHVTAEAQRSDVEPIREALRRAIESAGLPVQLTVAGEPIYAAQALPAFYETRAYLPAWVDANGPRPLVTAFLESVRESRHDGLRPAHYHLDAIEGLLSTLESVKRPTLQSLVDLDLLLTDAYLVHASHLLVGRIDPRTIDAEWVATRRERDLARVLEAAVDSGRIRESLRDLLPDHAGYYGLREALGRYRSLAARGGWPRVPDGPKLARGDTGPRVRALTARLAATGDLEAASVNGDTLTAEIEVAVRAFQQRHGLEPDGVVGPATLAALNVPVSERIRTIELNLERWRWLPEKLGDRYVLVNIANFELDVVQGDQPLLTMRAIVGRPYRRTPVFSDTIRYLVLSPYWHVPRSIAVQDILPQIQTDPAYLDRQQIRVFPAGSSGSQPIDPGSIDWASVTPSSFPYQLRQEPGPGNALGRIKFMFPNRFNVYLHDTPARGLFAKVARDFSSGCIRLEKPIELAKLLLRDDPRWTQQRILEAIERPTEQTVRLPTPVPVHLLYWTAWVGADGRIEFRNDIYDRDTKLARALGASPPDG